MNDAPDQYTLKVTHPEGSFAPGRVQLVHSGENLVGIEREEQSISVAISDFDWGHVTFAVKEQVGVKPLSWTVEAPDGVDEYFMLRICLEGGLTMSLTASGEKSVETKGDFTLLALPQIEPVRFEIDPTSRYLCIGLTLNREQRVALFEDVVLPPRLAHLGEERMRSPHVEVFAATPALIRIAKEAFLSPYTGSSELFYQQAKSLEALAEIAKILSDKGRSEEAPLMRSEKTKALMARDLLLMELSSPPSLGEIARNVGMSTKRLNAVFKQQFGKTIAVYLKEQKMEYAKQMVDRGGVPLVEIADRIGYAHLTNFVAAYRKHFGETPGEMKKRRS